MLFRSKLKTYVSYILTFCICVITISCVVIPQLKALYGLDGNIAVNYLIRLTIPFQHGFDDITAIIHLLINLILLWFLGTYLEKIIGSFRFLFISGLSCLLFVVSQRYILSLGQGFTPIIMTYAGVILVIISQSKYIKTRSIFEDYYRTLIGIEVVLWVALPIVMTFIPLYYDSNSSLISAIFLGNIYHVIGGLFGIICGFIIKNHIIKKLAQHTRKKYITHTKYDKIAVYIAFIFPLYLIFIFFYHPV